MRFRFQLKIYFHPRKIYPLKIKVIRSLEALTLAHLVKNMTRKQYRHVLELPPPSRFCNIIHSGLVVIKHASSMRLKFLCLKQVGIISALSS